MSGSGEPDDGPGGPDDGFGDLEFEILGPDDGEPSPESWSPDGSPGRQRADPSGPMRRPGLLVGGVLGLAALIVAAVAFGPSSWTPPASPSPAASPSVAGWPERSPSGSDRWTVTGPDVAPSAPRVQLSVVPLCAPVTDGGTELWVAFQVVNSGSTAFSLTGVMPRLPKRGLVRLQKVRAGGSCGQPGTERVDRVLGPTDQVLVTMQLKVLDTCPKPPTPFGVRVRAGFVSGPSSLTFPLFADLGSVAFSGC